MIGRQGQAAWAMWFLNDRPLYVRDFDNLESALRWSDQIRDQNSAAGWRLLPEGESAPAVGNG